MNDIIATILFIIGILLLVFAYVWYRKTIREYPQTNDNQPVIIYREIK